MATTPPTIPTASRDPRDDAFIREVDEAYREDEMKSFFRKWGRLILLAVALGLAALGSWFWWQAEQTRKVETQSEQFSAALTKAEGGQTTEAVAELAKLGQSANPSYRALSAMTQSGIAITGGETDKAAGHLRRVADDAQVAQPLRDVATMKLLRLEFDTLAPAEVLKRTEPYLVGDSPWFPVAGEMAALAHVKAGQPDKAGPLFYRIASDERTPVSMRARAEQMAAALGQDVTRIADERAKAAKAAADTQSPAAAAPK
ncbi:MAG: tetratricopeptide repeat protein [Sandaracinobacteroides sp.]